MDTIHDYSDFKDKDTGEQPSGLKLLQEVAQEQVDAEALVASLQDRLKEANTALNHIKFNLMPELMDSMELEKFTTKGGISLSVTERIRGSIPKASENSGV